MVRCTTLLKISLLISIICFISCKDKIAPRERLESSIQNQIDSIDGTVAVAFYNLSEPKDSLLINVDEKFHAASTMKVPVMIELYKQASEGKLNLNDSIILKNEFRSIVDGSLYSMEINDDSDDVIYGKIGNKVALRDLVYNMITVSSNLATNVLIEMVDAKKTNATMHDLGAKNIAVLRGVEDQKAYDLGLNNSTTARDLMVIMRALANNTAGSPADCEEMLTVLKAQQFKEIIPAYLPKEIEVAHKTGFITGLHHDAGIVYLPDGRSYVLVLLSKNLKDFEKGTKQLARLSETIFNYVTNKS